MTVFLAGSTSTGSVAQLLTVILIFIFVLAVTFYSTKFIGDYQKTQAINRNMEVIETIRIANNKYLQIVRVANKYIAIAVGKDEVSMLTEIDANELIDFSRTEKSSMKESFAEIMSKAGIKSRKEKDESDNNE